MLALNRILYVTLLFKPLNPAPGLAQGLFFFFAPIGYTVYANRDPRIWRITA